MLFSRSMLYLFITECIIKVCQQHESQLPSLYSCLRRFVFFSLFSAVVFFHSWTLNQSYVAYVQICSAIK